VPERLPTPAAHVASLHPAPATVAGEDASRPLFDGFKKKRRFSFF
jgi:hypothetical protein